MRLAIAVIGLVALTAAAYQGGAFAPYAGGFWAAVGNEELMLAAIAGGVVSAQLGGRGLWIGLAVGLLAAVAGAALEAYGIGIARTQQGQSLVQAGAILALGLASASAARPADWMAYVALGVAGAVFGAALGDPTTGLERAGGLLGGALAGMFGGVVLSEAAGARGGGSVRARIGAAIAGVGAYLLVSRLDLI